MDESRSIATLSPQFAELPLSVVLQIDALADRFEAASRAGETPSPEDYVSQLESDSPAARQALVAHLEELQAQLRSDGSAAASISEGVPQQIGEYRLLERLGAGGMGVVYKARHERLGRFVAIKFPRFAAALDPPMARRFLREVRLVGRLAHPNIVRATDAGQSPVGPYLVTEILEGETLEALVRRDGPLVWQRAVDIVTQAARALGYAHTQGVVHRDVKPSNLFLTRDDKLQVLDFGLAKFVADEHLAPENAAADRTHDRTFLGTVGYAAPEQLRSGQEIDARSDVYSLGCVLYFLLSGEAPHKGTLADRLDAERAGKQISLAKGGRALPADLRFVLQRMTATDAAERLGSMEDVEPLLAAVRAGEPLAERPKRRVRRFAGAGIVCGAVALLGMWNFNLLGISTNRLSVAAIGPEPPRAVAPFDAAAAEAHQAKWSEHLGLPRRTTNAAGMPLALIPPGEFEMGLTAPLDEAAQAPEGNWRRRDLGELNREHLPRHHVTISRPFYIGETEVTNAQFREFIDATGYVTDAERSRGWGREDRGWLKRPGYSWKNLGQRLCEDDYPVINVTWNDATALCKWLSTLDDGLRYRLPTEAEWEYVCRAGTTGRYFFGDDPAKLADYGWCELNADGRYRAVGLKRPNPFGIFDLYGNRQEWCLDNFQDDYYVNSPQIDPVCDYGGEMRVARGGIHTDPASLCTSDRRWFQEADNLGASGIRVMAEIAE
ncbi:MAG: bifunctional serine/threonine-protein kinase/formylglycine-generating enzyme family protein [Pirellulales bacterium]